MRHLARQMKRGVAAPLAALLLSLSIAVPLLERADESHVPIVESEHQPGSCPTPHDHTVCTQFGANHAAPGGDGAEQPVEILQRLAVVVEADDVRDARTSLSRSARAPPSV